MKLFALLVSLMLCAGCRGEVYQEGPAPTPIPSPSPAPSPLPPMTVTETFNDSLSAGDAPCASSGIHDGKPCRRYPFTATNSGTLDARLTWSGSTDLDLELWRGTTRLINTIDVGNVDAMTSSLSPGSYEARVVYYSGSIIQQYEFRISRPN